MTLNNYRLIFNNKLKILKIKTIYINLMIKKIQITNN